MPDETLLAFDYGVKKIGVALGNTLTRHARPLTIITAERRDLRFDEIGKLIAEWRPERIIVGLPLDSDGQDQLATTQARRFANQVQGRFAVPVALVDERGSSLEAQARLGTNAPDDAVAAAIILQRYLDALGQDAIICRGYFGCGLVCFSVTSGPDLAGFKFAVCRPGVSGGRFVYTFLPESRLVAHADGHLRCQAAYCGAAIDAG